MMGFAPLHPSYAGYQGLHAVANGTARADLLRLAEMNLLQQTEEGNKFIFVAPADLERRLAAAPAP